MNVLIEGRFFYFRKGAKTMTLFEELKWRGLIDNVTSPDLEQKLNEGGMTFYIGTDPTADSMHIGHFSSLLTAKRLADHGHHPLMLVGGATGFIGDPKASGERNMLTKEVLEHNYAALHDQISKVFGFEMVNNLDWTKDVTIIDFLRDYGKFFNVSYMINKETVKRRLETGISYTEFSYMILQSLDFLHLYETKNCTLQIGGQDQWGNITSGLELIRKKHGADVECYGLTMPLITKADGTKFGKSESGTIWLDAKKTSPYEMYQFLVNAEDAKVIEYLKRFTFLGKEEIDRLENCVANEPHLREAQKTLAKEVVTFLHGESAYNTALNITNALFKGDIRDLTQDEQRDALNSMEKRPLSQSMDLASMLVTTGIASSKREAREWIKSGSIAINGEKIREENFMVDETQRLVDDMLLVKRGKKNYYVITFQEQ